MAARGTRSKKIKLVRENECSSQTDTDGNSNNNYASDIMVKKHRKRSATPFKKQTLKLKVTKVTERPQTSKSDKQDQTSEEELDYKDDDLNRMEFVEGNEIVDIDSKW